MTDYPTANISVYVGDEYLPETQVKTATGLSSSTTGSCVLVSGTVPPGMTFQDTSRGGRQGSHGYWFYAQFKLDGHPTIAGTYYFTARGTVGNQTSDCAVTVNVTYSPDPIYFTVSYSSNGHGTAPQSDYVLSGTQIQLPSISDPNYTFNGWYTAGGTRVGGAGDPYVVTGTTMLYAHWTAHPTVNLTFINTNGVGDYYVDGTKITFSGTSDATISVAMWQNRTIQFVVTDTSHYQFDKFSFSRSGVDWTSTSNPYVLSNIDADVTIRADVVFIAYTITFDATTNGGTLSGSSTKTVTLGQQYGTLPTATKQHYTFDGWFTAATGGNRIVSTTVFNAGTDQTLYAQFQLAKYTVTWKNWDNSTLATYYNVPYNTTPEYKGEKPSKPATTQYYYLFTGWSPTPAPISGNTTYTAQYSTNAVTTYRIDGENRLNVFDYTALDWKLVDEAAFVLAFEAGGGEFTGAPPQIKINHCRTTDGNGKIIEYQPPTPYSTYNDDNNPYYLEMPNGKHTYIWAFADEDATEIEISIRHIPTENNGLSLPSGFSNVLAWEMITPYNKIYPYTGSDESTVTLNRAVIDNVRQALILPVWEPSNENRLRAIIVASGLGSLDLGDIQSINTTYNSRLTTIPIVCHGYTGSYCMDLGVSKTISISYVRVSPQNPNNNVIDSRQWDNATWVAKLKEFTDRWQMRTNGNLFYLKRPNNPRLANGYVDTDPMRDYIEEIDGENCYITSAPVRYLAGNPHMIKNTIDLTMGTLYPKQTPINMVEVDLIWKDPNNHDYDSYPNIPDRNMFLSYPQGTAALMPSAPYTWAPIEVGGNYIYPAGLYYYDSNGAKVDVDSSKYFMPGSTSVDPTSHNTTFYAKLVEIGSSGQKILDRETSGTSLEIVPTYTGNVIITAYLVGGGGGGGGGWYGSGAALSYPFLAGGGGAGGASGEYSTYNTSIGPTSGVNITITCVVGRGGSGGQSGYYDGDELASTDGSRGGETSITTPSGSMTVLGGLGGPRATGWASGGSWGGQTLENNSYRGGDGGSATGGGGFTTPTPHNGEDGTAPGDNYGRGGLLDDHIEGHISGSNLLYKLSGGGGGGGAISPLNKTSPLGGSGNTPPNERSMNGTHGSGGGGGSYKTNGGRGGDGVMVILVQNGSFEE